MMLNRFKRKTVDNELVEILDKHAEALIVGEDTTEEVLTSSKQRYPMLENLLGLTSRLYKTLIPVEPSETFVVELRNELESSFATRQKEAATRWLTMRQNASRLHQVVGTAISVVAIAAVVLRIAASAAMLIAFITGFKRRTAASRP